MMIITIKQESEVKNCFKTKVITTDVKANFHCLEVNVSQLLFDRLIINFCFLFRASK